MESISEWDFYRVIITHNDGDLVDLALGNIYSWGFMGKVEIPL